MPRYVDGALFFAGIFDFTWYLEKIVLKIYFNTQTEGK